jgi:hypothetical protein
VIIPTKPTSEARPQVRDRREEKGTEGAGSKIRGIPRLASLARDDRGTERPLGEAEQRTRIDGLTKACFRKAGEPRTYAAIEDRSGRDVGIGIGHGLGRGMISP